MSDAITVLETWHNLVINPKDLPTENKIVLINWKDDDYRVVRWLDSEKVFFDEITGDKFSNEYYPPIAWKEIN